ncbi:glycine oxidase [Streptomyces sp. C]|nr:glycine oxidase [Streptomyces sp. C]
MAKLLTTGTVPEIARRFTPRRFSTTRQESFA